MESSDSGASRDRADSPMSDWLRQAILVNMRRDPLLAAEDAIMLVDIFIALSRKALTARDVLSNPLIGEWLRSAITDNLKRSPQDALHDAECLRALLVTNLLNYYRTDQVRGPDADLRIWNIVNMLGGVNGGLPLHWVGEASALLRQMIEADDGGLSKIRECMEEERTEGDDTMAEVADQIAHMTESDLKKTLLSISDFLSSMNMVAQ